MHLTPFFRTPLRALGVFLVALCSVTASLAQTDAAPAQQAAFDPDLPDFYRDCPRARAVPDALAGTPGRWATNTATVLLPGAGAEATPAWPGVPRIAVWGDSHTAAGDFAYAAMRRWGFERSGIRPGMVAPALGLSGVSLPLKSPPCASAGWKLLTAPRSDSAATRGVRFGKTLMQISSETVGDYVWLDFRQPHDGVRLKWLNVYFSQKQRDRSLVLRVSVDNGPEQTVALSGTQVPFFQVRPAVPFASIRIRLVVGQISIHGFEPVYVEPPKAILDIFSIPGSTASAWSAIDPAVMGRPHYNTVLFQYGTNEATDPDYSEALYSQSLRHNLQRFRRLHAQARCIVLGPPDRGAAPGAAARPYTRIHQNINAVQAKLAPELGCVAWNWQAEWGGAGAAPRLLAANPPLMQKDQIHLTQAGYEASGDAFAKKISWTSHP